MTQGTGPLLGLEGYYGLHNLGDEALLFALVHQLKHSEPAAGLVVFTARPRETSLSLGVPAVHHALPMGTSGWLRGLLGRSRRSFLETVSAFRSLDWLIFGGGGVMKDMPRTSRYFLEIVHRIEWAHRLGHRVAALGVGVGPFHHRDSVVAARRALSKVELLTVRDEYSRSQLLEAGVPSERIFVTADLAFLLEHAARPQPPRTDPPLHAPGATATQIAVCARTQDLASPQVLASLSALLREALSKTGAQVWLIPFQRGGGEDDLAGATQLAQAIGPARGLRILSEPLDPPAMVEFLARMDMVVGEKLHAIILALLAGTPVLGLSYEPKVRNLFGEIQHPEWCLELSELTPDLAVHRFRLLWESRHELRPLIPPLVATIRAKAARNLQLLHAALAAPLGHGPVA